MLFAKTVPTACVPALLIVAPSNLPLNQIQTGVLYIIKAIKWEIKLGNPSLGGGGDLDRRFSSSIKHAEVEPCLLSDTIAQMLM